MKKRLSNTEKFYEENPRLRAMPMPHNRTIKPEFFDHEDVAAMQPLARLAWIGLWGHCDKDGRFIWRPKPLKNKILPYDDVDFESLLTEMMTYDFVRKYVVDGQAYGYIPTWFKHQGINKHERESRFSYPAPPLDNQKEPKTEQNMSAHASTCVNESIPMGVEVVVGVEVDVEMENGIQQPTNPPSSAVGGEGRHSVRPSLIQLQSQKSGQGKSKELEDWQEDLQLQVQKRAQEKGIVFNVPLPDSVFEYVGALADRCNLDCAKDAVICWLEDRSFDGLNNPNEVWNKMPGEIKGIATEAIKQFDRDEERRARKAAECGYTR